MLKAKKKKQRILAIDPGLRGLGIAVFHGTDLIYHEVKTVTKRKSPYTALEQGRKIVLRMVRDFRPDVLVIERTFFYHNRSASLLNVFVDEMLSIGRRKRLEVATFAPVTVKKFIAGDGQATKKQVAQSVIRRYPELKVYLTQDRKWKESYHQNMFDAVALGMTFLRLESTWR